MTNEIKVEFFGRVLNSPDGGAYSRKDGETYIETLTDNGWEKSKVDNVDKARAVYIVYKYGKYVHCGIRM